MTNYFGIDFTSTEDLNKRRCLATRAVVLAGPAILAAGHAVAPVMGAITVAAEAMKPDETGSYQQLQPYHKHYVFNRL